MNRLAAQKVAQGVDVVATKSAAKQSLLALLGVVVSSLQAATLPPDSVDSLYHRYDGGGMVIDGPSILVRKSVGPQFSLTGNYYVDSVSAASVDVLATASEYTEKRTEFSGSVDYLHDKTILSLGYTNSSENDFKANSAHVSVSQDFFGDLSNVTLGYSRGWDEVGMIKSDFSKDVDRQNYRIGFTQVLSKNALLGFNFELVSDEGYLNNPYRQYRYLDAGGYRYLPEVYPETRTSNATAVRAQYYLPYRASIKGEYRYFSDSWGIDAHTYEVLYVHPIGQHWTVEGRYRYYTQGQADFYGDLFPFASSQTYLARDKELSTFTSTTLGGGVSYEIEKGLISGVDRLAFNLLIDVISFEYDNFRDVTAEEGTLLPGTEPLYEFDAWVTRASIILEY